MDKNKTVLEKFVLSKELEEIIMGASKVVIPENRQHLIDMALGNGKDVDLFEVAYDIPGKGRVLEATVARCNNGAVVNYDDVYMRP